VASEQSFVAVLLPDCLFSVFEFFIGTSEEKL